MKKFLIAAAIVLSCALTVVPRVSAQSAMFIYSGVPVGALTPGSSFTIGVSLNVTTGGTVGDLSGLSYWWAQQSPVGGPFPAPNSPFAITNRVVTGVFTDLQSGLVYPQIMDPINRNPNGTFTSTDLGALITIGLAGLPSGTYPIANLTFSVAANAAPGVYTLRNTTSTTPGVGGRVSVWNDSEGDTAAIAASPFNITVIPEPSSIALWCVGLMSAGAFAYRRRTAAR